MADIEDEHSRQSNKSHKDRTADPILRKAFEEAGHLTRPRRTSPDSGELTIGQLFPYATDEGAPRFNQEGLTRDLSRPSAMPIVSRPVNTTKTSQGRNS